MIYLLVYFLIGAVVSIVCRRLDLVSTHPFDSVEWDLLMVALIWPVLVILLAGWMIAKGLRLIADYGREEEQ